MLIPNVSDTILSPKDDGINKILLPLCHPAPAFGPPPTHSRFRAFSCASPSFWSSLSRIPTWFVRTPPGLCSNVTLVKPSLTAAPSSLTLFRVFST